MAEDFRVVVASSKLEVDALLDRIIGVDCIQIFDERAIACREHLDFAYLNAVKIHERGESRSKSLAMEMLLCAAMTSQIGDAIKMVGAKSGRPFIVFADSEKAYSKISGCLIKPVEFNVEKKEKEARVRRLGIPSGKVEDLLQEIALHAMDR
jgi:tRNA threonylcarbamoyladenosine modification (KEOPS) complex Cgi121 subunit